MIVTHPKWLYHKSGRTMIVQTIAQEMKVKADENGWQDEQFAEHAHGPDAGAKVIPPDNGATEHAPIVPGDPDMPSVDPVDTVDTPAGEPPTEPTETKAQAKAREKAEKTAAKQAEKDAKAATKRK